MLQEQAERAAESIAILAEERSPLTYRRLFHHVESTARILRSRGLRRADRIAIVLPNGPEMAVAFLSAAAAAVAAPLNPGYRAEEFRFYLGGGNK